MFVKNCCVNKSLQKRFYHANSSVLTKERDLVLIRTALALTVMASLFVSLVPVVNASSPSSSMPSVPPAMEWEANYGGMSGLKGSQMSQTSDGCYAAAGNTQFNDTNAFWLVKTDANGNAVWSQTYGSGDSEAKSVVQTADGGYALAGNTGTYGAGASDAWLVKTDPHGNMLWNRTYGGAGLVTLHSGAGDVVVGSNGNGYDYAYSLIQTSDGDLALAGKTLMPNNYALAWLVKLDAVGNAEWNHTYPNRQMGGEGWIAYRLIETSDGGCALAGSWDLTGSVHYYFLVKTEPALPPPIPTPTPQDTS